MQRTAQPASHPEANRGCTRYRAVISGLQKSAAVSCEGKTVGTDVKKHQGPRRRPLRFTGGHSYLRGREGGGRWRGNGSRDRRGLGKIIDCPTSPGKATRSRPRNKTKRFLFPKQVHFTTHPQQSSGANFASILLAEGPREKKVSPTPLYRPQAESQCSAKWFKK